MGGLRKLMLLILVQILLVESANISPKLDFDDQSELVQVKKEIKGGKIKGLRVTVDTSELKESKSSDSRSSSSSESNEKKKTVGVRTDVTFEITSDEANDTKTVDEKEIGKDDDNNASIPIVPVFKGKPEKGGKDLWSVRPLDNPAAPLPRIPNYHQNSDRLGGSESRYDGSNDRYGTSDDRWKQFPQYVIWTTERYNTNIRKHDQPPVYHHRDPYDVYQKPPSNFIPYQNNHDRHHAPWQPCTCKEYPGPYINPHQPSSDEHRNQRIDDKLERPFSKTS